MTRQQVARRLGKSLATVRRIEGVLLHPTRDSRGVHRFDSEEVEALARSTERGHLSLAATLESNGGKQCPNCETLDEQLRLQREGESDQRDEELSQLRRENADLDRRVRRLEAEIRDAAEIVMRLAGE
ncbi:MAG TPA: hypothetical protein VGI10_13105 [Polyangiaceae bacterium]|jgi:hypothetical protein